MNAPIRMPGRIQPAPEDFLSDEQVVSARKARRGFMAKALAFGAGAAAAGSARPAGNSAAAGTGAIR